MYLNPKTVICAAGGASNIYKPRSVGEGAGRVWYAPWSSGSAYGLLIGAGAKMTQMENRIVLARFQRWLWPSWCLLPTSQDLYYRIVLVKSTNRSGGHELSRNGRQRISWIQKYQHLSTHRPIPTCLRNHALISEVNAGRGPNSYGYDGSISRSAS